MKRGDTYVKTPPSEDSHSTATVKRPRVHLGGKTNLPPLASARVKKPRAVDVPKLPRATHTMTGPVEYWGAVYSLSGEKLATGFIDAHGDESVVFARELPFSRPVRKREFVGAIQRSWGLGRKPVVTDLHPASLDKRASRGKGRRVYIGDGSHLPPRRTSSIRDDDLPSSFDLGTPTSTLTSVSDTEQEENEIDEGELILPVVAGGVDSEYSAELNQFSPELLCDDDMTRALTLGLHAVGVYVSNSGGNSQLPSAFSTLCIPDGSENLLQNKTTDQTEELASLSMPSIVSLTGASIPQDQAMVVQVSPTLGHKSRSTDAPLPSADCNAPPPSMHPDLPSPEFGAFLLPTDSAPLPAEFSAFLSPINLGVPPPSAGSLPCGTPLSEDSTASLSLFPQMLSKGTITTDVTSPLVSLNMDRPITMPLQPQQLAERPTTASKPQEPTPSLSASCPKTTSLDGSLNPSVQLTMSALSFRDVYDSSSDTGDKDTVTSRPSDSIPLPNGDI